jgi:hypothetical protein
MASVSHDVPSGYSAFAVGVVEAVSADRVASSIRAALESGSSTLHDYARRHANSKPLAGRGIAYAAPPTALASSFAQPARGLWVLHARSLSAAHARPARAASVAASEPIRVPTPELLAYAIYPAPFGFRRADVVTREVADSFDLSAVLTRADESLRARAWAAVADLLRRLAAAGARHHDLNVKNVLLRPRGDALEALALDVDRVTFESGDVMTANVARLSRSARKWREHQGATLDESELAAARPVFEARSPRSPL